VELLAALLLRSCGFSREVQSAMQLVQLAIMVYLKKNMI